MLNLLNVIKTNPSSIKSITTSTIVKVRKTQDVDGKRVSNPHFDKVSKINTNMQVIVGHNYAEMINIKLEEEGKESNFVPSERKWGKRVGNSCLIEHKNQMYLEVIVVDSGEVEYNYNNNQIDKQNIIGLSQTKRPNKDSQNGLESKVIVRTIKLENIIGFEVN